MIRARMVWILLLAALAGCSADGGPVGTGISGATIAGNVAQVEAAESSLNDAGAAAIPSLHVTIDEVPGVETTTDEEDGSFELTGDFSGPLTLRFTAAGVNATLAVDVPADSTKWLEDVEILGPTVLVNRVRVLGFVGSVALVDCAAGIILVNDRAVSISNQFLTRVFTDTLIARGNVDQALRCSDVRVGDTVKIEGILRLSDRTLLAIAIIIAPPPRPGPGPVRELRFRGSVAVINCESGMMMLLDDVTGQSRLRLLPTTAIMRPDHQLMRCRDIAMHDNVEGQGRVDIHNPGVIDALTLIVKPPPVTTE